MTAGGRAAHRAPAAAVDAVVMVAMADEAAPFLVRASAVGEPVQVGGAEHHHLTLAGRSVLLVRSGIGLVNAASAASVALASSSPRALVSAGSAGGLGVDIRVGDVVVGSSHVLADADARAFGYALGQVPGMPATYPADEALAAAASAPRQDLRVHAGTTISGDSFIDAERVSRVREAFPGALATDMESAALAQTAHVFGVPFVSVRGISDLCSPVEAGEFLTHVDDAADRSAAVVESLLATL
ncbi:5'-methylthioadenosine/adenosylhomocysteine nucleosidase [Cellulomonas edaphi]|uniref:adenosylhomocysteine nucleosidase n=1 Tax=Cellulomonas edaphi TaxID=3053468 RepID=A0ABT7SAB5_9CELL|nr:5'-methylthioadenosine/adenosylhomocysteine nucleosidase [Cellulomons edaphi]MDM7832556.1 5'-methylthioadenosine/adenosylhomocysteine nucleosidase [Cellulomons edaphi]